MHTPANLGAAPISHASAATTYGIGTTANYGHCMTINNLTATAHENGKALGAYQGAVLKESIDALQASLNALPKFISGTVVLTISGTAGLLFTLEQLRTMFGTTEFGTNNITTVIANGDGDASSAHAESTTWVGDNLYAVFASAVGGRIRVNYTIIYNPTLYSTT
ncbi:hypothetical protein QE152_g38930 [Popillia japonica]|uniref:Uncharacterized protein n=1 Tax=Popillia japonica TaxID=7064 RepID=A0AAW1HV28_POPJA